MWFQETHWTFVQGNASGGARIPMGLFHSEVVLCSQRVPASIAGPALGRDLRDGKARWTECSRNSPVLSSRHPSFSRHSMFSSTSKRLLRDLLCKPASLATSTHLSRLQPEPAPPQETVLVPLLQWVHIPGTSLLYVSLLRFFCAWLLPISACLHSEPHPLDI